MKQIYQYRYYSENHTKNQPADIAKANLVSGSIFAERTPMTQLGIQALPGTKFYLNNSNEPIIIGSTGIYELELNDEAEVTFLNFDQFSIDTIRDNENASLIVDTIYDDGEE